MMLLIKYRGSRPSDLTEIGHNFTNFEKSHWMMLHNKYQGSRTIYKNILFLYFPYTILCLSFMAVHRLIMEN